MKQVWNLETFFKGGSASTELAASLHHVEKQISSLSSLPLHQALLLAQKLSAELEEASAFIHCCVAQDTSDEKAQNLEAAITSLHAAYAKANAHLDASLIALNDTDWHALLKQADLVPIAFYLNERRTFARKKLAASQEALIEDLAVDGYHGWGQYYHTLVSTLPFTLDGVSLSQGQIENRFHDSDQQVRAQAFSHYSAIYRQYAPQFAEILNHLSGFRLKTYDARGWHDILFEPCHLNRLNPKTLQSLWQAVSDNLSPFIAYLDAKARLLNVDKLAWYDVEAPIGSLSTKIPYEQGGQFIVDHFKSLSPKMAAFSERALKEGWVEAEDRKGKRPGGFCINFPLKHQTRIFMTYSGTMSNISTLAHELGHAFHADCCFDLPSFHQQYRMNVAETASTMAEMIVADAALDLAQNQDEKLAMLDEKASRSVAFLMNIRARFLFESAFYEERKKGPLSADQLSQLMGKAQKEAYGNALASYHPYFWASKLHFFITEVPFYNFPYTFGYLFSLGIYVTLCQDKKSFEERYIALLKDSGQMTTEELARKHLGVDLTQPDFWRKAVAKAAEDAENFTRLTQKAHH